MLIYFNGKTFTMWPFDGCSGHWLSVPVNVIFSLLPLVLKIQTGKVQFILEYTTLPHAY
jgi:hypothetical protein